MTRTDAVRQTPVARCTFVFDNPPRGLSSDSLLIISAAPSQKLHCSSKDHTWFFFKRKGEEYPGVSGSHTHARVCKITPLLPLFGDAGFNWCKSKNSKSKSRGWNNCNAISLSSKITRDNRITPKHQKMALFDFYMCWGLNFMQQISNKMRIYCKISAVHKNERRLSLLWMCVVVINKSSYLCIMSSLFTRSTGCPSESL